MNANTYALIALVAASLAGRAALHAAPRSSANYSITTDSADLGGRRAASANYTNDGSAESVAGISTVAAPVAATKHGYVGQLYEIAGLALNAATPTVDEGATLQLGAWQTLDDATFLAVPATSVAWSVASGPLTGIDAAGLATAGRVYQDTPAAVQGSYLSAIGLFDLTVVNVAFDDFGLYAGDGIADDWQVQYFGLDNPLAAPAEDPDGDQQDNRFEWIAGLIPTDPTSVFRLRIEPVEGQAEQRHLIFGPIAAGRIYQVFFQESLLDPPPWLPLNAPQPAGAAALESLVNDPSATGPMKFYQVQITKP